MSRLTATLTATALFVLTSSSPVWACATCFGAQDSPQTKGMNMAIITMLGVTYLLFAAMIGTALIVHRNAAKSAEGDAVETEELPDPEVHHV